MATIAQSGNDPNKVMPQPGGNAGSIAMSYDPIGRFVSAPDDPYRHLGQHGCSGRAGTPTTTCGNPAPQITGTSSSPTTTGAGDGTVTEGALRHLRHPRPCAGSPRSKVRQTRRRYDHSCFLGDTEITLQPGNKPRNVTLTRKATPRLGASPIASEEVTLFQAPAARCPRMDVAGSRPAAVLIRFSRGPVRVSSAPSYLPLLGTPLGYGNNPALAPRGARVPEQDS